uniref:Uncharacterized protein n=1 Tax=Anguilla anguilla TaxID=7936 RepID=A0A0E9T543_ANGAN
MDSAINLTPVNLRCYLPRTAGCSCAGRWRGL